MTDNNPRRQGRHSPSRERDAPTDVQPLETRKLVRIWLQLPEADRLSFLVALDEKIGDQLLEATMTKVLDNPPDPWRSDSADVNAWVARQYARIAAQPKPKPRIKLDDLSPGQLRRLAAATSQDEADQLLDQFTKGQS